MEEEEVDDEEVRELLAVTMTRSEEPLGMGNRHPEHFVLIAGAAPVSDTYEFVCF